MSFDHPGPAPLGSLLGQVLQERGLGHDVAALAELNRLWSQAAGAPWPRHSWVIAWREGRLEIGTLSPALVTRLRFEEPNLRARLLEAGLTGLQEIRARVLPGEERKTGRRHRRYSPDAGAKLARASAEIGDPELRSALERLAGHLVSPPEEGR